MAKKVLQEITSPTSSVTARFFCEGASYYFQFDFDDRDTLSMPVRKRGNQTEAEFLNEASHQLKELFQMFLRSEQNKNLNPESPVKEIRIPEVYQINRIPGTDEWCAAFSAGSDDLFLCSHFLEETGYKSNRMYLIHFPDGNICKTFESDAGRYFSLPIVYAGKFYFVIADFAGKEIKIMSTDLQFENSREIATIPIDDNVCLLGIKFESNPLRLVCPADHGIQILWPEKTRLGIKEDELFSHMSGDHMYTEVLDEGHELGIIRYNVYSVDTGLYEGTVDEKATRMPDGSFWTANADMEDTSHAVLSMDYKLDDEILYNAACIFAKNGLTVNEAVREFLKETAESGELPFFIDEELPFNIDDLLDDEDSLLDSYGVFGDE